MLKSNGYFWLEFTEKGLLYPSKGKKTKLTQINYRRVLY